jgi:predicted ATPase
MEAPPPAIRTPDQRLRVFVSSTLRELAAERGVIRAAIERMGLAPVMFELGARPHPPRALYRAYLDQSDIFVGVYGERYGWVAPGEAVSGLEDEYDLVSPAVPKLIYIRESAHGREARLAELIDRIRREDGVSFTYFSSAEELAGLVTSDLAVLLAERFDRARHAGSEAAAAGPGTPVPSPLTELIGREEEAARILELLRRPSVRLVSLVGPGGIGKSRLAIDVATRIRDEFEDGATFVPLASVDQPRLVANAIALALGMQDMGDAPASGKLAIALRDQRRLLVLDNFEQVLDAAPLLPELLAAAPGVKIVVTTRILLRVSGEQSFEVGPLGLPGGRPSRSPPASVALFVERARAVQPDFELGPGNLAEVERICTVLEGVPLALELAAARVRILSPAQLLERLDHQLRVLVGGRRDLPPRQQALRSTIEWSTDLLTGEENALLAKLGVFSGRFTLEAAEYLAGDATGTDALTLIGSLVDSSLLRQQERGGRTSFSMLATVREYALEALAAAGTLDEVRSRHADYYRALATEVQVLLKGPRQLECLVRLMEERGDISAAGRHLLEQRNWDAVADFAWRLFLFFWAGGQLGEARGWMRDLFAADEAISGRTRAMALHTYRAVDPGQAASVSVPDLAEAVELFRRDSDRFGEALALISHSFALGAPDSAEASAARDAAERGFRLFQDEGDTWGQSLALITLGRVHLLERNHAAAVHDFERSLDLARASGNEFGATVARTHLAEGLILEGDVARAEEAVREAWRFSSRLGLREGEAYALEGLMIVAAVRGNTEAAGILLGAAEVLRERAGLGPPDPLSVPIGLIEPLRSGPEATAFDRGRRAGCLMSGEEALHRSDALSGR